MSNIGYNGQISFGVSSALRGDDSSIRFLGITVSMVSSTITVYSDNILHSMLKNSPYCLLDYCQKTASKRTHVYVPQTSFSFSKIKKLDKSLFVARILFYRKVFIAFSVLHSN